MKKFFLTCFLFSFGIFSMVPVFAECPTSSVSTDSNVLSFVTDCANNTSGIPANTPIKTFVAKIAGNFITLGSLLAVGAIVWAGIQYTKSFGEDEAMKKAKSTAIYALIGLFLLLLSFGLVPIIIKFVTTLGANS